MPQTFERALEKLTQSIYFLITIETVNWVLRKKETSTYDEDNVGLRAIATVTDEVSNGESKKRRITWLEFWFCVL